MASDELPPLDLTEDTQKYEARSEQKEVAFPQCTHKAVYYADGQLRCNCGAGWSGPGLDRLYRLLKGE